MRVIYPKELLYELRSLAKYLEFNGTENVVREDAPEGTKEKYAEVLRKMHELEKM